MSLDECFKASPPPRANIFSQVPIGLKQRTQLGSFPASRMNGSPIQNLARKAASTAQRPRKQFRRTLSMFEHPADVMRTEKKQVSLDVVMDVDENPQLILPNFVPEDKPDSLPRINQETMLSVLNGEYKGPFDRTMVIDCRFEYEFNGGHIDGAINFNDKDQLAKQLFSEASSQPTLIILHCEYSAHRAPLM
jgi:M-phase inducer tyrosine phosphatase